MKTTTTKATWWTITQSIVNTRATKQTNAEEEKKSIPHNIQKFATHWHCLTANVETQFLSRPCARIYRRIDNHRKNERPNIITSLHFHFSFNENRTPHNGWLSLNVFVERKEKLLMATLRTWEKNTVWYKKKQRVNVENVHNKHKYSSFKELNGTISTFPLLSHFNLEREFSIEFMCYNICSMALCVTIEISLLLLRNFDKENT